MIVQEIMKRRVETASPDLAVGDAVRRMEMGRIRHLVIIRGDQVLGVVSDRDIGAFPQERDRAGRTVGEMMTPFAATASPAMPLRQAANLLRGRSIGCLPVLEDGRLVGIITVSDLLELVGKGVESPIQRGKRWTIKHRTRRRTSAAGAR